MTTWTFKQNDKNIDLYMQLEGQPEVLLSQMEQPLHQCLTAVAEKFQQGDIVITPEGCGIFSKLIYN